ncbi:aldehyde dehydrogenase [Azospirillum sp. 412522]|nr:aldehyde dehydrogenase family protein [Azospirillum sp. 412522]MBY6264413.1 aldehyde dehydrogenase [Azospirillum sp. 412522]
MTVDNQVMTNAWSSSNPADIFAVNNPATGEIIARVQGSSPDEVDQAVKVAHNAFLEHWRDRPARERGALLIAAGKHLQAHAQELAELVSRENGKPVRDALQFDVASLTGSFDFFGALAGKGGGEYLDLGYVTSATIREPFGVVAGIIPFNWPPIHTGAKVAPALAAGNTIVVKPGDQAPLTIMRIVELLQDVLPNDIVHCVTGVGPAVGQALTQHQLVRKISFTGAPSTGTAVLKVAAERHVPVLCELGGKNPFIVMADADLDKAVRDAVDGAFFNKGEACTAASRILLHQDIHDAFMERFCAAVGKLVTGDGALETTHVGPVVSLAQKAKIEDYLRLGVLEGATIAAQGKMPDDPRLKGGYFVPPTVFTDVTPSMRIAQEEIFGPVTCVMKFSNETEAISIANGTQFGLVAGIYSTNQDTASRMARQIEAGIIFINNYNRVVIGTPFGGTKSSGYGREHCAATLNEFTYAKAIRTPTGRVPVPEWKAVTDIFNL